MTNNQAAELIMSDNAIRTLCRRINNGEDILQDLLLYILEMDNEKLNKINDNGYLIYYCIRTIMNMTSKTGRSNKYSHHREVEYPENIVIPEVYNENDRMHYKILLDDVNREIDNLPFYYRELFKIYIDCGSYRKTEAETNIFYYSVKNCVDKVRGILRSKIELE